MIGYAASALSPLPMHGVTPPEDCCRVIVVMASGSDAILPFGASASITRVSSTAVVSRFRNIVIEDVNCLPYGFIGPACRDLMFS
jgi:hypothetical protein